MIDKDQRDQIAQLAAQLAAPLFAATITEEGWRSSVESLPEPDIKELARVSVGLALEIMAQIRQRFGEL